MFGDSELIEWVSWLAVEFFWVPRVFHEFFFAHFNYIPKTKTWSDVAWWFLSRFRSGIQNGLPNEWGIAFGAMALEQFVELLKCISWCCSFWLLWWTSFSCSVLSWKWWLVDLTKEMRQITEAFMKHKGSTMTWLFLCLCFHLLFTTSIPSTRHDYPSWQNLERLQPFSYRVSTSLQQVWWQMLFSTFYDACVMNKTYEAQHMIL